MTETDNRRYTCCFTGHRDFKAVYSEKQVRDWLRSEILLAIEEGYDTFITGMCYGIDIIAAEEVLKLRAEGNKISLIAALPYSDFGRMMPEQWRARYKRVLDSADRVYTISRSYSKSCFSARNRWMVDHSSRLIAVYNGARGGTYNTVMYAVTNRLVLRISPGTLFHANMNDV